MDSWSRLGIFTLIFSPSSVFMYYFIFAVTTCRCLEKYLCMSSTFLIAILKGTSFPYSLKMAISSLSGVQLNKAELTNYILYWLSPVVQSLLSPIVIQLLNFPS